MSFSDLSLAIPGGASVGDTVVTVMFTDQTISVPTGWTQFQSGNVAGLFFSASSHTVVSGDLLGTTWDWTFGGATNKAAYLTLDFANVTGLDTTLISNFSTAVTTMAAPVLSVSNNETCVAVWAALGGGSMHPPSPATVIAESSSNGNIAVAIVVYTAPAAGNTPTLTATFDLPLGLAGVTGMAAQASLHGAGSHIVSVAAGSV